MIIALTIDRIVPVGIIKLMDNYHQILDSALNLFSLRGFDAVGVQEVVEAVGLTKPTLYHYFNSKRGLLDTLIERETAKFLPSLRTAVLYEGDLVLTLENVVRTFFSFAKENQSFYQLQLSMFFSPIESISNQAIRPFIHQQHQLIENIFIQAVVDHGNLRDRQKRYATGLLGGINAMIGHSLMVEGDFSDEEVYLTTHQFTYGIFS